MSRLIIILCEDRQQEIFTRQWLLGLGFRGHEIAVRPIPAGRGSGEMHVRHTYPVEVKALRKVNSHDEIGRALVTVIDADTFAIDERHSTLDHALLQDGQRRRNDNEKIAILVPKRNIETWIHHIQGVVVNEIDAYRKLNKPSDCKADITRFVGEPANSPIKTTAPDSLQLALVEMERIA